MRIKKVSETTPVQAQIVDGYSESTTDGYSANYINKITSAINVGISTNATISTSNTTVVLTLNTTNVQKGTGLTLSNGSVVVGAGINYVLVSANVLLSTVGSNGNKRVLIQKNGNDVARAIIYATSGENYQSLQITPFLLSVTEGDIISLGVNTVLSGSDTSVVNSASRDTYLNVMAI